MAENTKAKLFQKILAVQRVIEPLEKTGRNNFHRYNYTTAGDVLLPVQRACNEQGLVISADCIDSKIEPGRAEVTVQLTVFDSETGESHSVTAPGYAEDFSHKDGKPTGDKAVYKALTGATKYAVRSFFCLPSEDDPERTLSKSITTAAKANANNSERRNWLIQQTDIELKRLGWSSDRGRLYLQQNFDKSTRQSLSEQELQQFLSALKLMQPSAQLPG